ncbi:hypothetical protein MMUR_26610 [Mycolicibacterium murale]|uniref:DUF2510 domain-containing protein n=1 Tax=Mycolicibacterium murale TaxID=182220 RepID=A0A7I9WLA5_9MYCO|nr:DUF2510 domain-containing protein [Mycolicibacterium murale]GFG58525.1 hypothetical protein MMUR_26610 [Mycolicibacterium murale]
MTGPSAPAGWYPDPASNGQLYWDGRVWAPAPTAPRPPKKSNSGKIAAGVVAAVVAFLMIGNLGDDKEADASSAPAA